MTDLWTLLALLTIWAVAFYTLTRTVVAIAEALQAHAPTRHLRLREKYRALSQTFDFIATDPSQADWLGKFEYHRAWLERHDAAHAVVSSAASFPTAQDSVPDACGRGVCSIGAGHAGDCR